MNMRLIVLTFLGLLTMAVVVSSQNSPQNNIPKKSDSTDDVIVDIDFASRKPIVSLLYGSTALSREGIAGTVENATAFGGSLGMANERTWFRDKGIVQYRAHSLYGWVGIGADAQSTVATTTSMDLFRIGLMDESGFGYKFSETSNITFLVASAPLSWTSVTPLSVTADPTSAQSIRDFEDGIRFGESMRPTIAWRIAEPVSLRVGYEWSQIYPRHMFWYWMLSQTIEGIADGAATWFAREIGKASPGAMPVVYFLLRNGVAAGFKALRMNQMNWPFTTVAPLNSQMWNVGVAIHF
ncbi:MAG: hypothetical protein H7X70_01565 [Candidatus Kapabacteria bacterium]|nr:hypothetical protein [Candidatus Kapabacteria bacterium]